MKPHQTSSMAIRGAYSIGILPQIPTGLRARRGEPGVQLTRMDRRLRDLVVTPRIGKPVEIQALWLNALEFAAQSDPRWQKPLSQDCARFANDSEPHMVVCSMWWT